MKRLSITIDDAIKQELDNIAPKGERAAFVSKAIKKAIDDYHAQQALKKILAFKPYKIEQDSIEVLQEVREGRATQVIEASKR
jgi:metal-responsive CopG/Arc/MetJ family transcriptional regulator